jgi:hypothetical protein
VLAAVKTSATVSTQTLTQMLRLRADGTWTSHPFGTVQDNHTRPIVQVDIENRQAYMFATSACCRGDAIYYKQTSLDALSFPAGRGAPFIQGAGDLRINNPTGTKQALDHVSGLLVLASDDANHTYVHNYRAIAGARPPGPPPKAQPAQPAPPAPPAPAPADPSGPGVDDGGAAPRPPAGRGSTSVGGAPTSAEEARVASSTVLASDGRPQPLFFGWFSAFMAFTGANLFAWVAVAAVALLVGAGLIVAARRRLRRARSAGVPVATA